MVWSIDFQASASGSGDEPPATTNGTCGFDNGGTICGDWPTGDCCSSSGWCGSGDAYCGSGCQSGSCISGQETTDGTCGAGAANSFCGSWPQGSCCSSSGFCGSTDAHCGNGCQSGCPSKDGSCGAQNAWSTCPEGSCCSSGGLCGTGDDFCRTGCQSGSCEGGEGNIVDIDPQIFIKPGMTLQCFPPCTFVLPPQTLDTASIISIPPVTETIEETWPLTTIDGSVGYTTITKTIIITVPILTTSVISYSNIVWSPPQSSSTSSETTEIYLWSSIVPPGITLTETSDEHSSAIIWTYSYGPWPTATTTPSSDRTPDPSLVWGRFPVRSGPPKPLCTANCGEPCRNNCGPPGLPHGPSISIPCIGLGCPPRGGGGGGGGGGCVGPGCTGAPGGGEGGQDGDPTSCETTKTASQCAVVCTTTAGPEPCSTTCFGLQGCGDIEGTTTTVTKITDVPAPFATMPTYDNWGPGDLDEGPIRQQWDNMRGDLARYIMDKFNISAPDQPTRTTTGVTTTGITSTRITTTRLTRTTTSALPVSRSRNSKDTPTNNILTPNEDTYIRSICDRAVHIPGRLGRLPVSTPLKPRKVHADPKLDPFQRSVLPRVVVG